MSSTSYVYYICNKVSYFILPCFSTGPGDWIFLPTQEISESQFPILFGSFDHFKRI